jgi:hypothetical protein
VLPNASNNSTTLRSILLLAIAKSHNFVRGGPTNGFHPTFLQFKFRTTRSHAFVRGALQMGFTPHPVLFTKMQTILVHWAVSKSPPVSFYRAISKSQSVTSTDPSWCQNGQSVPNTTLWPSCRQPPVLTLPGVIPWAISSQHQPIISLSPFS